MCWVKSKNEVNTSKAAIPRATPASRTALSSISCTNVRKQPLMFYNSKTHRYNTHSNTIPAFAHIFFLFLLIFAIGPWSRTLMWIRTVISFTVPQLTFIYFINLINFTLGSKYQHKAFCNIPLVVLNFDHSFLNCCNMCRDIMMLKLRTESQ